MESQNAVGVIALMEQVGTEVEQAYYYVAQQIENELVRLSREGETKLVALRTGCVYGNGTHELALTRVVALRTLDRCPVVNQWEVEVPTKWAERWFSQWKSGAAKAPVDPMNTVLFPAHPSRFQNTEFHALLDEIHAYTVKMTAEYARGDEEACATAGRRSELDFFQVVRDALHEGLTLPSGRFYLMNTDPKSMEYVCQTRQGILRYRSRTNADYGLEVRDLTGMLLCLIGDLNVRPPTLQEMQAALTLRTVAPSTPA